MSDVSAGRPGPDEARRLIFGDLDLTNEVRSARAAYDWSVEEAAEAELEYRRFLWLCYLDDGPAGAIHSDADKVWHHHILNTRGYAADCDRMFGHFLHHSPTYAIPEEVRQESYQRGLERYRQEFHRPVPKPTLDCFH